MTFPCLFNRMASSWEHLMGHWQGALPSDKYYLAARPGVVEKISREILRLNRTIHVNALR